MGETFYFCFAGILLGSSFLSESFTDVRQDGQMVFKLVEGL